MKRKQIGPNEVAINLAFQSNDLAEGSIVAFSMVTAIP